MALPRLRPTTNSEDQLAHPNQIIYTKMELLVRRMLEEHSGVPIRTVTSFLSKIPSVFTGMDLVTWITRNVPVEDLAEALHLAHMISSHGYLFQIDNHILTVKNDGNFYRFQTPYFWSSNCWQSENIDYAVYLCKRTMQNKTHLKLEDFEAENLAKLQKMFSRKWEFIFLQAEAQYNLDVPIQLKYPSRSCLDPENSMLITSLDSRHQVPKIKLLQTRLAKNVLKTSKLVENYVQYFEHRRLFDPFLVSLGSPGDPFQRPSNPWLSDTVDFWQHDKITSEISIRRLKLWEESFDELLADVQGRETLQKFLDKEYSGENLRFWWQVQRLRMSNSRMVPVLVTEIYSDYIDSNALSPVNIDCKVLETTEDNLKNPNRWSFDEAAEHIFNLVKNDSYQRFLRSDIFRDLLAQSKKKGPVKMKDRFPTLPSFSTGKPQIHVAFSSSTVG